MTFTSSYWFWIGVSIIVLLIVNLLYRPNESKNDPTYSSASLPSISTTHSSASLPSIATTLPSHPAPTYQPINVVKRSKGEAICCQVMEELTGKRFTTVRPPFLKNPETNRNLEIDCYNDELKIGVEYNGIQHYVYPNFTGQSYEQFINQVRRDEYKIRACDEHGVYLITVPYTVPHDQIRDYLIDRLRPLGPDIFAST